MRKGRTHKAQTLLVRLGVCELGSHVVVVLWQHLHEVRHRLDALQG